MEQMAERISGEPPVRVTQQMPRVQMVQGVQSVQAVRADLLLGYLGAQDL
jgi:hypothetical protein